MIGGLDPATAKQPTGPLGHKYLERMRAHLDMPDAELERLSLDVAGTSVAALTVEGCYRLRLVLARRLSAGVGSVSESAVAS